MKFEGSRLARLYGTWRRQTEALSGRQIAPLAPQPKEILEYAIFFIALQEYQIIRNGTSKTKQHVRKHD